MESGITYFFLLMSEKWYSPENLGLKFLAKIISWSTRKRCSLLFSCDICVFKVAQCHIPMRGFFLDFRNNEVSYMVAWEWERYWIIRKLSLKKIVLSVWQGQLCRYGMDICSHSETIHFLLGAWISISQNICRAGAKWKLKLLIALQVTIRKNRRVKPSYITSFSCTGKWHHTR